MKSFALLIVLFSLVGCQTIVTKRDPRQLCNGSPLQNEPVFLYSGARCDLRLIPWVFTEGTAMFLSPIVATAAIIDLPLSAAANTVILPWSIYQHVNRKHWTPPPEDTRNIGKPVN